MHAEHSEQRLSKERGRRRERQSRSGSFVPRLSVAVNSPANSHAYKGVHLNPPTPPSHPPCRTLDHEPADPTCVAKASDHHHRRCSILSPPFLTSDPGPDPRVPLRPLAPSLFGGEEFHSNEDPSLRGGGAIPASPMPAAGEEMGRWRGREEEEDRAMNKKDEHKGNTARCQARWRADGRN